MCGRVPDLQLGGCRFESHPGLLRTKLYSAFHPSGVGKWVPAAVGKAKAGMAHSDCGWTCGCAGKTVRSLENTCHTWALLRWCFTAKRRYIKCMYLYLYLYLYLKYRNCPTVDHAQLAWTTLVDDRIMYMARYKPLFIYTSCWCRPVVAAPTFRMAIQRFSPDFQTATKRL